MIDIQADNCSNSRADDLRRVVMLSEEIRKVIDTSAKVRLSAINAMLSSRRAGTNSRSFAVVSAELRSSSRRLDAVMERIAEMISDLVSDVALLLRKKQQERHLQDTLHAGVNLGDILGAPIARQARDTAAAEFAVKAGWTRMLPQIRDASRLCAHGAVLSRNARIEAVHGGSMEKELQLVADQMEESIINMLSILKNLEKEVAK